MKLNKINIFEAQQDWLTKELRSYDIEEPQGEVQGENPCYICNKGVTKFDGYAIKGSDGFDYVHTLCAKNLQNKEQNVNNIDCLVCGKTIDSIDPDDKHIFCNNCYSGFDIKEYELFRLLGISDIKSISGSLREFISNEYRYTNNIKWIKFIVNSKALFRNKVLYHLNRNYHKTGVTGVRSFYNTVNGNTKTAIKYIQAFNFVNRLFNNNHEYLDNSRYFLGFNPDFFYKMPDIINSSKNIDNKMAVNVLKTMIIMGISGIGQKSLDHEAFYNIYNQLSKFSQKALNNTYLRLTSSHDRSAALGLVPATFDIDPEVFYSNNDNTELAGLFERFWDENKHRLQKLFGRSSELGDYHYYYCKNCYEPKEGTGSFRRCKCGGDDVVRTDYFMKPVLEEIDFSGELPPPDAFNSIVSLVRWVNAPKSSTSKYRVATRRNDRKAQKQPIWAIKEFSREYHRGLRLAPLYQKVLLELENRISNDDSIMLVIHGRDGEMIYELAKVLNPKLYKRMVYIISSRPLTSERDPGFLGGDAVLLKYNNYISRILPKGQKAIHIDTGFAGSIPNWFKRNGWNVSDIGLVSTEIEEYGLLGSESLSSEMRKVVLRDLEHAPQRLAKIKTLKDWSKLRYSKYAPGFWSRLYGIIGGINGEDPEFKKAANFKKSHKSLKDYAYSKDIEDAKVWED